MSTDDAIITKIQALLAKAERTEFEAEAEAFYAKASELMLRHAIDEQQLAASRPGVTVALIKQRFTYSANDANRPGLLGLLNVVARANRCRMVYYSGMKKQQDCELFGTESDIEYVKILYTSLHMQAYRDGGKAYRAGNQATSKKVFMTNFLIGFALVVDERLRKANDTAVKEVGTALVLADRSDEIDQMVRAHGAKRGSGYRTNSAAATAAGRESGAKANLSGPRNNVGGNSGALGK